MMRSAKLYRTMAKIRKSSLNPQHLPENAFFRVFARVVNRGVRAML